MQLNISESYAINSAILLSLNSNSQAFSNINIESDYWLWLQTFISNLYTADYYDNQTIPTYKMHALPNLNVMVSPIRITQRRMKMVPNEDIYTKAYITEGWASLGFGVYDPYNHKVEDISDYSIYTYTNDDVKNMTFFGLGGFV